MRLVSQNGMIDVPYEISALSVGCYGRVFTIYIRSKLLDEKPCEFATYSTEEKAVKVMEMVREESFWNEDVFQFPKDEEVEI